MTNRELMELHVAALFSHDASGRLVQVNEPNGAPAPRVFLGGTADGPVFRSRFDVHDDLRNTLEAACLNLASSNHAWTDQIDPAPFRALLERTAPVQRIWTGPAFSFPSDLPDAADAQRVTFDDVDLLRPFFADWIADVLAGCPLVATVVADSAVAVCCSVRRTAAAHEAGVETAPAFRGRGFAVPAVAEWARDVRARGCVPLYSTSWDNTASRAVARKLNLLQFGSDLHIT